MVGAGEGFLPSMNPNMIDQLVLGLEGPPLPGAVGPVAGVVRDLRPAHVLHGQVGDNLVHRAEGLIAGLAGQRLVRLHPQAGDLLLHRLPHVTEERSVGRGHLDGHAFTNIQINGNFIFNSKQGQ